MNYRNIKIDDIKIDSKLDISYEGKPLIIKSPILYLPFGIENIYNNIILKLQMKNNIYNDNTYTLFTKFIEDIEKHFNNITQKDIKSQLSYNKQYGNTITTKIIKFNDKIKLDVYENINSKTRTDFYNIVKKSKLYLDLLFDRLWLHPNNIIYYKIKVKNIYIV